MYIIMHANMCYFKKKKYYAFWESWLGANSQ